MSSDLVIETLGRWSSVMKMSYVRSKPLFLRNSRIKNLEKSSAVKFVFFAVAILIFRKLNLNLAI